MLRTRGRQVVAALAAMLLLVACSPAGGRDSDRDRDRPRDDAAYDGCSVHYDDVRGTPPSYAGTELARFDNDDAMCRALWLPTAERWFVPQGLALDGGTAWVSGFRWHRTYSPRSCRLVHVDLSTGRRLASTDRIIGAIGGGRSTFCRHGGSVTLDRHGLWILEQDRLWLVDPDRVGHRDQVLRVWRTHRPVRGSALVDGVPGQTGVSSFQDDGAGRTRWYSTQRLLAAGVTSLVGGPQAQPGQVAPLRTSRSVRRVQGATVVNVRGAARGLWSTSSTSTCGMLIPPKGRRVALGPGAEEFELDGRGHVWVVLESGARNYQRDGRPLVPMLARFDLRALLHGSTETCDW